MVFDERSGGTHQCPPLSAAVLAWFETSSGTVCEMTRAVAEDWGVVIDDELIAAMERITEQFRELGWIEPVDRP